MFETLKNWWDEVRQKKTEQINVRVQPSFKERVERLRELTGNPKLITTITYALALYEHLAIESLEHGSVIEIHRPDGAKKWLAFPWSKTD